ncbi:MAG: hypothetical protein Q8O56_03695, partial [Solirubrobacteraceae bacterium]|nr:hypothetical protein [Solirubrobacteraceae bacterium]
PPTRASAPQPLVARLARTPQPAATTTPPAAPERPASTTAQALARATAGAIEYEDDGRVGVLLPPPGAVFAAPGTAVARDATTAGDAPVATAPSASSPAPDARSAPAAGPALDRDELYADFMRRLRRDALEQREQIGEP